VTRTACNRRTVRAARADCPCGAIGLLQPTAAHTSCRLLCSLSGVILALVVESYLLFLNVPDRRAINYNKKKNKLKLDKVKNIRLVNLGRQRTSCHANAPLKLNSYTTSSSCHASMPSHTSREAVDNLKINKARGHHCHVPTTCATAARLQAHARSTRDYC
jgi:hypothetical protein